MSQEHVKLVKRVYAGNPIDWVAAFADGSFVQALSALEPLLDPDFEISFVGPDFPGLTGKWRGIEGFETAYAQWLPTWASYRVEAEDFLEAADNGVLVLSRWGGRTKTG